MAEAEVVRAWWLLLLGTSVGCSPLVSVEGDDSSGPGATSGSSDGTSTGSATAANPSGPSPSEPNPTGPNPTGPATSVTGGTTTIGVDVDTGEVESGDVDTGEIRLDLPPVPEAVCIPTELYGSVLEVHPSGWVAFEGCEPNAVILQAPGAPPLLTADEVETVSATYGMALFGMPGAVATGVGLCCSSELASCLSVDVQTAELQLNESLAYANELFASLQTGCVGVRFNLVD